MKKNVGFKCLLPLVLIAFYWFYLHVSLGYFLSKIFYNFFDEINKTDFSKSIQLRKKFSLENLKKIIVDFCWKFIKNWVIRIRRKFWLLIDAINLTISGLRIFRKKFKSILKFKRNLQLLKKLLLLISNLFLVFCSFVNELLFLDSIRNWVIQWMNVIRFLMNESVWITRILYLLYWSILAIFGIIVGFLFGVYKREDEINLFLLLLLLKIIYNNGFNEVLVQFLPDLSLETNTVEPFSKFSSKTIEPIHPRPLKLVLKETPKIPLPFLIIEDPLVTIDIEVLWDESTNYQFKLFKFYRDVDQKI